MGYWIHFFFKLAWNTWLSGSRCLCYNLFSSRFLVGTQTLFLLIQLRKKSWYNDWSVTWRLIPRETTKVTVLYLLSLFLVSQTDAICGRPLRTFILQSVLRAIWPPIATLTCIFWELCWWFWTTNWITQCRKTRWTKDIIQVAISRSMETARDYSS